METHSDEGKQSGGGASAGRKSAGDPSSGKPAGDELRRSPRRRRYASEDPPRDRCRTGGGRTPLEDSAGKRRSPCDGPRVHVSCRHLFRGGACDEAAHRASGGEVLDDLRGTLAAVKPLYQQKDERFRRLIFHYPGSSLATNSFLFANGEEGVYFGCHDPSFQETLHVYERSAAGEVSFISTASRF
ncbi:MAG: hypothetical protein L6W00_06905 [Lentisphaeria bacterium]|nr:MAG: hypothetical protein L6W00_06905 [Lentisphaeria bacterium]